MARSVIALIYDMHQTHLHIQELSRLGASLDDMNQLQSNVFKQWQTAEQHRVESAKVKNVKSTIDNVSKFIVETI